MMGSWLCERTGGVYTGDGQYIGLADGFNLQAVVGYDHWNGVSINMHVAAEGSRWMTKEYLRYCFHYPFNEIGVKKIVGLVDESNEKARRFDEHLGFKLETRIKDACKGGDLLIYSMTRQECRFIKE